MLGVTCCEVVCVSVAEEQLSPLTGVHNHWPPYEQAKVWGGGREEGGKEGENGKGRREERRGRMARGGGRKGGMRGEGQGEEGGKEG